MGTHPLKGESPLSGFSQTAILLPWQAEAGPAWSIPGAVSVPPNTTNAARGWGSFILRGSKSTRCAPQTGIKLVTPSRPESVA